MAVSPISIGLSPWWSETRCLIHLPTDQVCRKIVKDAAKEPILHALSLSSPRSVQQRQPVRPRLAAAWTLAR
jgi:hypothetical protein